MDKQNLRYRIAGGAVVMTLLLATGVISLNNMTNNLPITHPELEIHYLLLFRYATIWNVVMLVVYLNLVLVCDVSSLLKMGNNIPTAVRRFRLKLFYELLFPASWGLAIFWPIYFYDREWIYPLASEVVMGQWGNFVFHGVTILYVHLELTLLPKDDPKREELSVRPIFVFELIYLSNLLYTRFVTPGVWVYDALTFSGPIMFLLILNSRIIAGPLAFYAQFYLKDLVWKMRENNLKEQ